ncbi:MAG: uroporphyrinogen decarboxylase family protein [Lentisphaeria bacterium]|jgi:hypothetical protein|nr:uroporphyrinogen decarboxylase family protein [Lentisphaeria bacterium]
MKADVLSWLHGEPTSKRPSKETLNHPGIIELVSGCDVKSDTPEAFARANAALGIDIINVVPEEPAPPVIPPGEVVMRKGGTVQESYLGVFNTTSRIRFPYDDVEEFWQADVSQLRYDDLDLPGAQYLMPCTREAIESKMSFIGDAGVYYYQMYTTLFMWGVEALGWEIFMIAAALDAERFDKHFLEPCFEKTKDIVTMLSTLDTPLVVCHDDIAAGTGPMFRPEWYETYIYPRYAELWQIPHAAGKKVLFVADGKLDWALESLRETGCDGVFFETPATDLDAVIDVFGDGFYMGGIDAQVLTLGTPDDVRRHTEEVLDRTRDENGIILSCSGGLIGNMPQENVEAYFDTRVEYGFTERGWRDRWRA